MTVVHHIDIHNPLFYIVTVSVYCTEPEYDPANGIYDCGVDEGQSAEFTVRLDTDNNGELENAGKHSVYLHVCIFPSVSVSIVSDFM